MQYISERLASTYKEWVEIFENESIPPHSVIDQQNKLYCCSRELQFILEEVFQLIIKKSKFKSGNYAISEEIIEANSYKKQSTKCISKDFNIDLELGVNFYTFSLEFSLAYVECIAAQKDGWWKILLGLIGNYDFQHWDYQNSIKSSNNDTIRSVLGKLLSKEIHQDSDLGRFTIYWGSLKKIEASIIEGGEIFKAIHQLNQSLSRTKYTREKRRESRINKK